MGMIVNQEYMDNEVIKPIMLQLDEIRKLIKSNDRTINTRINNMSENIARIPKKRR